MNEDQLRKIRKLIWHPIRYVKDGLNKKFPANKNIDYRESFSELIRFTQSYNVNSLKVNDEYIWPYLRNHLWAGINSVVLGNRRDQKIRPYRIQGGHPSQISDFQKNRLKRLFHAREAQDFPEQEVDFLFFVMQNATEKVQIADGQIYHRIMDPLYESALTIGTALKIEVIRTSNLEQNWDKYVHPVTLLLLNIKVLKKSKKLNYDPNIFKQMRQHIRILDTLDETTLNDLVDYELSTRDYYIKLFSRVKPKVIFINFYHRYAPLCSAAHALGIPTIDVQHGLQKGWNPLYNNFAELKGLSYQALPQMFGVWSRKDYDHILNTFDSPKHKPILLGNPWLKKMRAFGLTTDNISSRVNLEKLRILIIMQKKLEVPLFLKRLIENAPENIQWIVRHHPKGSKFKVAQYGASKDVLVDRIFDTVLISELSPYVDIAISEGSALSLEIADFGVESIIFGQEGYDNYKDEILSGDLHYVQSEVAFFDFIRSECWKNRQLNQDGSTIEKTPEIENTLRWLLNNANNQE